MRGHGYASGLNSQNIDDHCILRGPVTFDDLLLMSQGRDPNSIDVMVTAKHDRKSTDSGNPNVHRDGTNLSQISEPAPMLSNGAIDSNIVELGVSGIKQERGVGTKRNTADDELKDGLQDLPRKRIRKSNPRYDNDFVPINALDGLDEDDEWTV